MIIETIAATEVEAERSRGSLLLDVRSAAEFRAGHVREAVNLPLELVTAIRVGELRGGNPARKVVLLCASGRRATTAAERLTGSRLQLLVVSGGTLACAKAGLPIDKSQGGVISLERQVRIAAGGMVLIGVVLGTLVDPWFHALGGFVGAGLIVAGVTDWCGMGLLLARAPWNR